MLLEEEGIHFIGNKRNTPKIDTKQWGIEQIICRKPHACKIMTLYPGYAVSFHWHREKTESFLLIEGELIVELIDQWGKPSTIHLTKPYSSVTIEKNMPHTFYCPEDQEGNTVFIEASTTDSPDDSYRIYPSGPRGQNSINRRSID